MKPTASQLFDLLRVRIVSGEYPPGFHLTEESIAQEFGISRSPVRTALRQLAEILLVEIVPNQGAYVAEFTISDVKEVFELRKILEAHGAGLAALHRNIDDIARLEDLLNQMRHAIDTPAPIRTELLHANNEQFHHAILLAAKSPRLREITMGLASKSTTLGSYFGYDNSEIENSYQGHEEIFRAIERRQPDRASSLMWVHLDTAKHSFVRNRFGLSN